MNQNTFFTEHTGEVTLPKLSTVPFIDKVLKDFFPLDTENYAECKQLVESCAQEIISPKQKIRPDTEITTNRTFSEKRPKSRNVYITPKQGGNMTTPRTTAPYIFPTSPEKELGEYLDILSNLETSMSLRTDAGKEPNLDLEKAVKKVRTTCKGVFKLWEKHCNVRKIQNKKNGYD